MPINKKEINFYRMSSNDDISKYLNKLSNIALYKGDKYADKLIEHVEYLVRNEVYLKHNNMRGGGIMDYIFSFITWPYHLYKYATRINGNANGKLRNHKIERNSKRTKQMGETSSTERAWTEAEAEEGVITSNNREKTQKYFDKRDSMQKKGARLKVDNISSRYKANLGTRANASTRASANTTPNSNIRGLEIVKKFKEEYIKGRDYDIRKIFGVIKPNGNIHQQQDWSEKALDPLLDLSCGNLTDATRSSKVSWKIVETSAIECLHKNSNSNTNWKVKRTTAPDKTPYNWLLLRSKNKNDVSKILVEMQKDEEITQVNSPNESCNKKRSNYNNTWKASKKLSYRFGNVFICCRSIHYNDDGTISSAGEIILDSNTFQIKNHDKTFYLRAILCHRGPKIRSGHYFVYVKYKNMWWRFGSGQKEEDKRIEKVNIANDIVEKGAKIIGLFYSIHEEGKNNVQPIRINNPASLCYLVSTMQCLLALDDDLFWESYFSPLSPPPRGQQRGQPPPPPRGQTRGQQRGQPPPPPPRGQTRGQQRGQPPPPRGQTRGPPSSTSQNNETIKCSVCQNNKPRKDFSDTQIRKHTRGELAKCKECILSARRQSSRRSGRSGSGRSGSGRRRGRAAATTTA